MTRRIKAEKTGRKFGLREEDLEKELKNKILLSPLVAVGVVSTIFSVFWAVSLFGLITIGVESVGLKYWPAIFFTPFVLLLYVPEIGGFWERMIRKIFGSKAI